MIKLVYLCMPDAEDALRINIYDPRNRNPNDFRLVVQGYKLALDFDADIQQVLSNLTYHAHRSVTFKPNALLRSIPVLQEVAGVEAFLVEVVPTLTLAMDVYKLGDYEGVPVYALTVGTCFAKVGNADYKQSVSYHLATIEESLDKCADAEFYTAFLKDAVQKLVVDIDRSLKHAQSEMKSVKTFLRDVLEP